MQKGGGVELPTKFSKRGVLAKISIFRGQVVEKEWMTFSGGNRGSGVGEWVGIQLLFKK